MDDIEYRKRLLEIAKDVTKDNLDQMKFCLPLYGKGPLEEAGTATQLFQLMEQRGDLAPDNLDTLRGLLGVVGLTCLASGDGERGRTNDGEAPVRLELETLSLNDARLPTQEEGREEGGRRVAQREAAPSLLSPVLLFVSESLGREWRLLSRHLRLPETDIAAVSHAHRDDLREQAHAALLAWAQRRGRRSRSGGAAGRAARGPEVDAKRAAAELRDALRTARLNLIADEMEDEFPELFE